MCTTTLCAILFPIIKENKACAHQHRGCDVCNKIAQLLQEEAKHLNCILSVEHVCVYGLRLKLFDPLYKNSVVRKPPTVFLFFRKS